MNVNARLWNAAENLRIRLLARADHRPAQELLDTVDHVIACFYAGADCSPIACATVSAHSELSLSDLYRAVN